MRKERSFRHGVAEGSTPPLLQNQDLCNGAVLVSRRLPNFARSIGVHRGNAEPDDEIGPG